MFETFATIPNMKKLCGLAADCFFVCAKSWFKDLRKSWASTLHSSSPTTPLKGLVLDNHCTVRRSENFILCVEKSTIYYTTPLLAHVAQPTASWYLPTPSPTFAFE